MGSQFEISPYHSASPASNQPPRTGDGNTSNQLLLQLLESQRQILEVQKQILTQLQATAAAQDPTNRWRHMLTKWDNQFPDLPQTCREVLPMLERAYGVVLEALTEELADGEKDALDNEYALQDFVDRYGMKVGQLGNIMNLVAPLAEAGAPRESSSSTGKEGS
ncbi:MAG: hypothetical protein ACFCD0_04430 [Gemmataceae bacterium]